MAAPPGGSRSRLVSTYYDSAERALARHSLVLRVRRDGGRYVQTVKSAGTNGASMLGRGEWEDEIGGERPDPDAAQTGRFLSDGIRDRLLPVFSTKVMRLAVPIALAPETRIEAAVDRGNIRAAERGRSEPISEIELELRDGPPTALYDIALRLLEVAPVRIEPRSKAERGFRLSGPRKRLRPAHFGGISVDPADRGEEALRGVGHACLRQILGSEAAALAGQPAGIHQMRVALRRLRAILSAFGMLVPKARREPLDAELRWLTKALGAARNLDVFAGGMIAPAKKAALDGAALDRLGKAAEHKRRAAYAAARRAIRSPRYTALLLRLMRWFDGSEWRGAPGDAVDERLSWPVAALAPLLLERRRRAARKRSRNFAGQSPEQRHQLRIALKKLRYTAEVLAGLYDADETRRYTQWLKRLQDRLGAANDLQTGRKLVAELAPPRRRMPKVAQAGQRMLAWRADRLAEDEPKLRSQIRQFYRIPRFWRDRTADAVVSQFEIGAGNLG
jgi:inorganic triphosphatase YgiF